MIDGSLVQTDRVVTTPGSNCVRAVTTPGPTCGLPI
jgi:hypothetical protein